MLSPATCPGRSLSSPPHPSLASWQPHSNPSPSRTPLPTLASTTLPPSLYYHLVTNTCFSKSFIYISLVNSLHLKGLCCNRKNIASKINQHVLSLAFFYFPCFLPGALPARLLPQLKSVSTLAGHGFKPRVNKTQDAPRFVLPRHIFHALPFFSKPTVRTESLIKSLRTET